MTEDALMKAMRQHGGVIYECNEEGPRLTREQENNMYFQSGFNDALMLVQMLYEFDSWEEAVKHFDWDDREMKYCSITQNNLEQVREIWEAGRSKKCTS